MRPARAVMIGAVAIAVLTKGSTYLPAARSMDSAAAQPVAGSDRGTPALQVTSVPVVTVRAASGETIRFKTQNGQALDDVPSKTLELPHLVLFRNDALTAPDERALSVEVAGIRAPASGVTVTLEVTTQHGDPDAGSGEGIRVWQDSRWIAGASDSSERDLTVIFTREFTQAVDSGAGMIPTPTDYFRYDIAVVDALHPDADPWHTFRGDHAFLMENQSLT